MRRLCPNPRPLMAIIPPPYCIVIKHAVIRSAFTWRHPDNCRIHSSRALPWGGRAEAPAFDGLIWRFGVHGLLCPRTHLGYRWQDGRGKGGLGQLPPAKHRPAKRTLWKKEPPPKNQDANAAEAPNVHITIGIQIKFGAEKEEANSGYHHGPALHRPVPFSNSCSQGQSEHLHSYLGYSGAELIHSNVAAEAVAYVAHPPTKKKSLHLSFGIILAITTNRRCCSLS